MTVRFHLFPFRTQKLSSLVPKIVRWKRRVKIGSRRLTWNPWGRNSSGVCFFARYFLSLAKELPKVSIFAWFFCALCYNDIEDAGWPIPFYNDVLSSDLGSTCSTLDRRKEIRMKKAVRRATASLLSTTLFLSVAITPVLAKDRISKRFVPKLHVRCNWRTCDKGIWAWREFPMLAWV